MNIEKIKQKTIVGQVMDQLKQLIASGSYKTGDRIPTEKELAEMFGIGRSSVREAIKTFQHLGILEPHVAKGYYVCDRDNITKEALTWSMLLGKNDFLELMELRLVMERQGYIYLMEKHKLNPGSIDKTINELTKEINAMAAAIEANQPEVRIVADYNFHGIVIGACGNYLFNSIYQTLRSFVFEEIKAAQSTVDDLSGIPSSHQKLVDCIKTHDVFQIMTESQNHIKEIKEILAHNHKAKP
jgi:GntR family transcriptional regulator, transcriptional repressor for pyruvate dehydrogenase complex